VERMQTVYIDVYIFINIFEDLLLLLAVKYILRLKTSYLRLAAGCAAGGVLSLFSLINTIFIINILVKIIGVMIIVLIVFGYKSKKAFIKATSTLIIVTFLVSGALICFYLAFKPKGMAIINDNVYFNISPLLLIILTLFIYFILLLYRKLFKNKSKLALIKDVKIQLKGKTYEIKCKVDSGMNVKEPFSGSSVIIIEKDVINISINQNEMRVIPFKSLGKSGLIYGFKIDKLIIDNKEINEEVYTAIYNGVFSSDFQGLIPESILGA